MSFLKNAFGKKTTQQKPQEPQPNVMQSMYELDEKKQVIPPSKSYEMESIKPGKPPITKQGKTGGLFSKMKVKKPVEQKKQEITMTTYQSQQYVATSIEESKVQTYQPPDISHVVQRQQATYEPPVRFFSKKESQVQSFEAQNKNVGKTASYPIKRKNSSNSAAQLQHPIKQLSSKKSSNYVPPRSTTNKSVRSTSKSHLNNKSEQIPVRRKSEAKLDEIKQIQNQMLRSKEKIIQKMRIQKDIKNRIMNETQSLMSLKERQNDSIQKQNAAVESQQYDKAAQLQQQLGELKQQIQMTENQLQQLEKEFTQAEQNICSEYVRQQQEKAIFKKRLIRAKSEAQKAYQAVMKTQTQKIELQKVKMQRDRKKLTSLQTEISFNQQKIKQLQNQYQQDLNNQTKLFKEQKDDLSSRKLQISDDIHDLEKRLQQKRNQLLQVQGELQQADYNIEEVKKGFENQYRKIVQRKDKLYQMQLERDEFKLGLNQLQVLTQQQTLSLDNTLKQMNSTINFIAEQSQEYSSPNTSFKDKLVKRETAFSQFMKQTTALKQFQNIIKVKHDKLKELQFKKSSLAMQISLFESKRKQFKEKIPQLENQKIALVSSKNFKGAQLKSTQIKEANEQLVLLSSQIEQKFIQQKNLDKHFADAQQALDAEKETQDQLKKNLAKSQYKLQSIRFNDLSQQKLTLSRYTSTQKAQMVEFVQSQIAELKQELDYLASQYQLQTDQQQSPQKYQQQSPQKQPHQSQAQANQQQQNQEQHQELAQQHSNPISYQQQQQQQRNHYQNLVQQKQDDKQGYINASPLDIHDVTLPDHQQQRYQQPSQQKQPSQKLVEENQQNNNQKSEEQSIEQVKNETQSS